MVGVDVDLGVDEDEKGLLDGVQAGNRPALGTRDLHLDLGLHVDVYAEEDVFAAVRDRGEAVDGTRIRWRISRLLRCSLHLSSISHCAGFWSEPGTKESNLRTPGNY